MGWFWQSSAFASPAAASAAHEQAAPAPTAPAASPRSTEHVDPEIRKLWAMLEADTNSNSTSPASPPAPADRSPQPTAAAAEPKPSSWSWGWSSSPSSSPATPTAAAPQPPPRVRSAATLALSETQLPTTMSCRDAFDYAFHCNTPGSQWTSVYRYGQARTCSDLWDDFWFCMRTRSYEPAMRAEAIRDRFRAKEEAKYGYDADTGRRKPSSEDVWESRETVVEKGSEFAVAFPPPEADDREMQREEIERRRRIREELGFEKK